MGRGLGREVRGGRASDGATARPRSGDVLSDVMGGHWMGFLGTDAIQFLFKGCFDCFSNNGLLSDVMGEVCRG